jgi:hypothetical protein
LINRPWRSTAVRGVAAPRPPVSLDRMPLRQGRRLLKSWSYVAAFSEELMMCAGSVRVAGIPQSSWAIWDRSSEVLGTEATRLNSVGLAVSTQSVKLRSGSARLELTVSQTGEPVEVVSPLPGSYMWTKKVPVRVDGHLAFGLEARPVSAAGILDTSGGYQAHGVSWEWSAGTGTDIDGRLVTWNLVKGIHDASASSERTVWVEGRPDEVPPVRFSSDLDEVWGAEGTALVFVAEATRHSGLIRSHGVQSFGRFFGCLPGGIQLADDPPALGVMERHHAIR